MSTEKPWQFQKGHTSVRKLYKPEYCEMLIDHCKDGRSFKSFAAVVMVAPSTLFDWAKNYPEFGEAKELALACGQKAWEDRAINVGDGGGGPGAANMVKWALGNYNQGETEWKEAPKQVELTGKDGGAIETLDLSNREKYSQEWLEKVEQLLLEADSNGATDTQGNVVYPKEIETQADRDPNN